MSVTAKSESDGRFRGEAPKNKGGRDTRLFTEMGGERERDTERDSLLRGEN